MKTYRIDEYHELNVNKIANDFYEVDFVELIGNRKLRLSKELYNAEALELEFNLILD